MAPSPKASGGQYAHVPGFESEAERTSVVRPKSTSLTAASALFDVSSKFSGLTVHDGAQYIDPAAFG